MRLAFMGTPEFAVPSLAELIASGHEIVAAPALSWEVPAMPLTGHRLVAGNRIVDGAWWPKDYAGPPLVSVDLRAAKALSLKVGDMLTVSVLGVEIPARIASLREIDWDSMGLNFGMIFSPSALAGAPHSYLATITLPGGWKISVRVKKQSGYPRATV